jgi:hypothetical protein
MVQNRLPEALAAAWATWAMRWVGMRISFECGCAGPIPKVRQAFTGDLNHLILFLRQYQKLS